MPIYEYECDICHQIFEKLVFSSEKDKPVPCPKCGDTKVHRVLSLSGFLGSSCLKPSSSGFS